MPRCHSYLLCQLERTLPTPLFELIVMFFSTAGLTPTVQVTVVDPLVALTVTVTLAATGLVGSEKVYDDRPAAIVSVPADTLTAGLLSESDTVNPLGPAGAFRDTRKETGLPQVWVPRLAMLARTLA